jgi:hypothetical protein
LSSAKSGSDATKSNLIWCSTDIPNQANIVLSTAVSFSDPAYIFH